MHQCRLVPIAIALICCWNVASTSAQTLDVDFVITGIRCNESSSKTSIFGIGDDTDETYILVMGVSGDGTEYSKRFPGNDNYYSCKKGTFYDEGRQLHFKGVDDKPVSPPDIGHWALRENEKIALVISFADQQNKDLQDILKFVGEHGPTVSRALAGAKDDRSNLEKNVTIAAGELLKSITQGDYPLGTFSVILENKGGKLLSSVKGEHFVTVNDPEPWGSETQRAIGARLQTVTLKGEKDNCNYDIWIWLHAKSQ